MPPATADLPIAIVTGGAGGLGRFVSCALARDGPGPLGVPQPLADNVFVN